MGEPVKIGVLVKRGPERCLERWSPTAEYLTDRIPGETLVIVPLDYEKIHPSVASGAGDFTLANPFIYVETEILHGANQIATLKNMRPGKVLTNLGGVIFHRADRRDIRGLPDLRGKSFMAVEETSLGGWLAVWRELK